MPRVRIVHTTEYRYSAPVRLTEHRLMMRPHDSHDLRVLDATLWITPPGARTRWAHDVFGNSVCILDWENAETEELRIVSALDLKHYPTATDLPIEPAAETYPFRYAGDEYPDLSRLMERHYADPDRQVEKWARSFLRPGGTARTRDLLIAMTQAIKSDFTYEGREAKGTHPPLKTLAERKGACRDFAVLMMEAARSLGFAARFVSGYLYDEKLVQSEAPMKGGGATHAWCAIYLPGAGWVEYDPTNGLIAGRNLIRVCMAREPHQALPLSGGYLGRREDFSSMTVRVEVAVGDPPTPGLRPSEAGRKVLTPVPDPEEAVAPEAVPEPVVS
ncbi:MULTISPECIES: transglutaminase family protein [unclassified Acidisoma]|jgi:transglutaminase-like putative cysteine protease|uniref:transglutaminase family protein n=1 Tax=unclassified Acidisoma TaxID=2634065 RepID=UPI00131A65AF|nr:MULTISPECIES: transglutaminase family protein [unclassified Acidisoma]